MFKPVGKNAINYVNISNEGMVAGVQPFEKRVEFWDKFYKKHGKALRKVVRSGKDEL